VWLLFLDNPGPNRQRVMLLLKAELGMPFGAVQQLLATEHPKLLSGPKWRVDRLAGQLAEAGASARVTYDRNASDRWIRPELSIDKIHCAKCGSRLFRAIPGETTPEEIRAFALSSQIDPTGEVARTGWIHPGVYCPAGCGFVMANLDDD
jgi:hypothetical protein